MDAKAALLGKPLTGRPPMQWQEGRRAVVGETMEQQDISGCLDHFTKARRQKEARIDSTYTTLTYTSCEIHTRVDSRYTRLDSTHIQQCNIH